MRFVYASGILCPYLNQTAHTSELCALWLVRKLSLQTKHISPNLEERVNKFEAWQIRKGIIKHKNDAGSHLNLFSFFKSKTRQECVMCDLACLRRKLIKAIEIRPSGRF